VADVVALGADGKKVGVISTINGDANIGFYKELAAPASPPTTFRSSPSRWARKNFRASTPPTWSVTWPPGTTSSPPTRRINEEFIAAWKAFAGEERVTNDPMEAHYIGFNMWVHAVEAAGTTDVDAVRDAMYGQEVPNLTGGTGEMLPNHHLTKPVLIGEIRRTASSTSSARPSRSAGRCLDRLPAGIGGAGLGLEGARLRHVQHRDRDLRADQSNY
jgi:urea transport system substrate-binding protein